MNNTAELILEKEEITTTDLPLVYELSTRGKSQWQKRVTEKDNRRKEINCAKIIAVDVRSKWNAGPKMGLIEIQYVPGAPTIFKNDYVDANGERQPGLISLKYDLKEEYRRAVEEDIKFVDGMLFLENYGGKGNLTLLNYMHHHGSNEASPNFKRAKNMNTMFLFKPQMKEKKAATQLDNLEIENEAHNLFTRLRTKTAKGFDYDVAKIDAILGILNIGGEYRENESSQKMLAIKPYINAPVKFMKAYNDSIEEYQKTINLATQFKALVIKGKEAKIAITGVAPLTIELSNDSREKNVEELIFNFMGTESGKITYQQLLGEVDAKKIEALK